MHAETNLKCNKNASNIYHCGDVSMKVADDILPQDRRREINNFLHLGGWTFGWKSDSKTDYFAFWHKHFAGNRRPDNYDRNGAEQQYACEDDLQQAAPLIHALWQELQETHLQGHRLMRCYANGNPYGGDGSVHTDSINPNSYTSIYYPHEKWQPNWAGETVMFNRDKTEIIAAVYPRPNRLFTFNGTIPHVARGVSRSCPVLRVTLMFKKELPS